MSDWFFGLSILAMAIIVFAVTYLLAAIILLVVTRLATGDRAKNFKALTPAMLSPLGAVFALLLVFSAEPVWTNYNHAKQAIAAEASGLRDALILAQSLPAGTQAPLRKLISAYVAQSVNQEWPAMAQDRITELTHNVCGCSEELLTAMQYMRGLTLADDGQRVIQRDIIEALEKVRTARRERILVSEDDAGDLRFLGLVVIGLCLLTWIGLVHSDNRRSCAIALGLFATVIAMSSLLIVSYTNPFSGGHALSPRILQEVME
jgi:hypothetical protein